jgi:hypothetical protein
MLDVHATFVEAGYQLRGSEDMPFGDLVVPRRFNGKLARL